MTERGRSAARGCRPRHPVRPSCDAGRRSRHRGHPAHLRPPRAERHRHLRGAAARSATRWRQRRAAVTERGLPYLVARTSARGRPRLRLRGAVPSALGLPVHRRGFGLRRSAGDRAAASAGCCLQELIGPLHRARLPADGRGDRRLRPTTGRSPCIAALGFRDAGRLRAVGCKFDRWIDVVFMQRALAAPPPPHRLKLGSGGEAVRSADRQHSGWRMPHAPKKRAVRDGPSFGRKRPRSAGNPHRDVCCTAQRKR